MISILYITFSVSYDIGKVYLKTVHEKSDEKRKNNADLL